MAAPTEWTYDGQLDWSSADSLRLAPAGLVLQTIIEAIKERYAAVGVSPPALLAAEFNPLIALKGGYIDAIQAAVTELITGNIFFSPFANHTLQGGDFSGLDMEALPIWTELDMLTAIGAEERLVLYPLSPLSSKWFRQQYQFLNLMRWLRYSYLLQFDLEVYQKSAFNYGTTPAAAWNLSKNDIDSAAWSTDWMAGSHWHASNEIYSYDPPYLALGEPYYGHASIQLKYSKGLIQNKSNLAEYKIPFNVAVDIYARTYFESADNNTWYQAIPGLTLPVNALARMQADLAVAPGETTEMNTLITTYSQPDIPPANEDKNKSFAAGWAGNVYKFDVEGGFKFID